MNLDAAVLETFLHAKGQYISGTRIGNDLGLSRVSIHNHLESLRKDGFRFSAIRNKGYRLEAEPEHFHPALFEALMSANPCPLFAGYSTFTEVDSTNSLAELDLAKGRKAPFFLIATSQTAGRGRRGRNWHSPDQKNLYMSVALRPSITPSKLQTITLWIGLRLCMFLRDRFSLPVLIKWPNDLMLHNRKIAGLLTEARVDAEQTRDLVIGLGLNVNALEKDFPEEIRNIASSLAANLGKTVSISRIAHEIVQVMATAIQDYLDDDFSEELTQSWPEFDYLRGRTVKAENIEGRVLGISSNGSLRMERANGSTLLLHSGEVSIGS